MTSFQNQPQIKTGARFLIELLVVFLGVYAASYLNDYQKDREARRLKVNYCETVIREMRYFISMLDRQRPALQAPHQVFKAALEQGQTPSLQPILLNFDYRGLMIEAAAQEMNFEAIGKDMAGKIIIGNNLLVYLENRFRQYDQYTAQVLLPNLNKGTAEFYDRSQKLRPKYQWYVQLADEILVVADLLKKTIAEEAIPDIERQIKHLQEK